MFHVVERIWELQLTTSGPAPRSGHSLNSNSLLKGASPPYYTIMFGGFLSEENHACTNEVWAYKYIPGATSQGDCWHQVRHYIQMEADRAGTGDLTME